MNKSIMDKIVSIAGFFARPALLLLISLFGLIGFGIGRAAPVTNVFLFIYNILVFLYALFVIPFALCASGILKVNFIKKLAWIVTLGNNVLIGLLVLIFAIAALPSSQIFSSILAFDGDESIFLIYIVGLFFMLRWLLDPIAETLAKPFEDEASAKEIE